MVLEGICVATIRSDSERAADWRWVFGSERVPVETPVPFRGSIPGRSDALLYMLALRALTPTQRERLVVHICRRFRISRTEVEAEIDEHGVPVLADDVFVEVDARAFL